MPSRAGPEDMGERQPLPLYPLDSLTPFVAGPLGPDPGWEREVFRSPRRGPEAAARDDTARGLGEGSGRLVIFRQERSSGRIAGPAGASRVLGPQGGWGEGMRCLCSRFAAALRVEGIERKF